MAKPHGSVRIGPISLFTLIIILCLAVLAVLSVTTARAELSITERQAATTTETYELESAAQRFVAEVDRALGAGDAALAAVLADYGIVAGSDATPAAGETIEDDTMVGATHLPAPPWTTPPSASRAPSTAPCFPPPSPWKAAAPWQQCCASTTTAPIP